MDGAGKTMFGDELAVELERLGRPVIRASIDGFHNPREVRYRRGRASAEGFFEDSYDYELLRAYLLDPLGPDGDGRYRAVAFGHRTDSPVAVVPAVATIRTVLVFDGIFLHRPDMRSYWDFSVFLRASFDVTYPRMAARGDGSADPHAESNRRYLEGQQLYLGRCSPEEHASVVIDNKRPRGAAHRPGASAARVAGLTSRRATTSPGIACDGGERGTSAANGDVVFSVEQPGAGLNVAHLFDLSGDGHRYLLIAITCYDGSDSRNDPPPSGPAVRGQGVLVLDWVAGGSLRAVDLVPVALDQTIGGWRYDRGLLTVSRWWIDTGSEAPAQTWTWNGQYFQP